MNTGTEEDVMTMKDEKVLHKLNNNLILHNDDVNSFDKVIALLMEYCGHEYEQATQCAYIVHNNGKCSVKQGSKKKLQPIKEALQEHSLTCSIE